MLGFVFQGYHLIGELTVRENILLPLQIAHRKDRDSRLRQLLAELDLADLANGKPSELSAGHAKRVAVARALANEPRVLLADEPTASLDSEATEMILGLFERAAEGGTAAVIASHDHLVRSQFDPALRLEGGRLGPNSPGGPPRGTEGPPSRP